MGGRRALKWSAIAVAAVVIAAGAGIGIWQAVEHLGQPSETLVIGDAVDSGGSPASGYGALHLQVPRSVSEFKLADLWEEVATRLWVDPSSAWLRSIQLEWDADGLLSTLYLQAGTPDGRDFTISAFADPRNPDTQQMRVSGSTGPSRLGMFSERGSSAETIFVGVDTFLAALDRAGLMEIAAQSGLDITSDPAESFESARPSDAFGPEASVPPGQVINSVVLSLQWTSEPYDDRVLTSAEELAALEEQGVTVFLKIDEGEIDRLGAAQLSSVLLPALDLALGRSWTSTDETGENGGSWQGLGSGIRALLSWSDEGVDDKAMTAQPVDDRLDGLAFTTVDRDVCRIQGGTTETLWDSSNEDLMTAIQHPSASYGVSYSLGKTLVLRGGGIVETTTGPTDAAGSWEGTSGVTAATAVAIPVDDPGASWELLRFPTNGDVAAWMPTMNRVVFDEGGDRLWLDGVSSEVDKTGGFRVQFLLQTAQPHTSDPVALPLGHPFGGDFAVSPDGSTIVYIGLTDGGPAVTLRTGDVEKKLSLGLATAYHPVFSPDGSKICLVGSKKVDGDTSLWLYDLKSGDCRQIEPTEGLTPTYPAFSPDGERVAFRHFKLGDIWTVTIEGGDLTRFALTTEEAPIAW